MFEPQAPPPPPKPVASPSPSPEGTRALRLLEDVRAAQRRAEWTRGILFGGALAIVGVLAVGLLGAVSPSAGRAAAFLVLPLSLGLGGFFGVYLANRRVGTPARTARLLQGRVEGLDLDLLAALELSKALGEQHDFSPQLARAFLRQVDGKLARARASDLIEKKPQGQATWVFAAALALAALTLFFFRPTFQKGLTQVLASRSAQGPTQAREPITGDFELTFRYPGYTGLESRTLSGVGGDISAPVGTEVLVTTRADRDVDEAALLVDGRQVPLTVKGRELSGSLVLEKSGHYHVAFLDGRDVTAEGPDMPITALPDLPPEARLLAPINELEVQPESPRVGLRYEVTDDYGVTALAIVYRVGAGQENRVTLRPDDGRTTRGQYTWDLSTLALKPGQTVSYFLEAKDNDSLKGPKPGVSRTQVLRLYSSAEHRRAALKKAEALWERLVTHLADRMEGEDRQKTADPAVVKRGDGADGRAQMLSADFLQLARELGKEREPALEVLSAMGNIGDELTRDTSHLSTQRRVLLSFARRDELGAFKDLHRRLVTATERDITHSERNVLYLESLLDRQKLEALKEMAQELKAQRRELSALLEQYSQSKDPKVQEALLQQMSMLRERMAELQQRMAELSKGIRDEFINREALSEMMQQQNLGGALDDIEKLVREGKAEEALKKMQELSMQMDELFESLDDASNEAEMQADPELAAKFQQFSQQLDETAKAQAELSDETRALRDKYRAQAKERIEKQGAQVKKELTQKLNELASSYQSLDADRFGSRLEEPRARALREIEHTQEALEANDFDLASEAAERLVERAASLEGLAQDQRSLDEMFHNPQDVRRDSRQLHERLARDLRHAEEVSKKLQSLFPQANQQMSEADKAQLSEQAKKQGQLQQQAQSLEQQMQDIAQRAPIFDEAAQQSMRDAQGRMGQAKEKLSGRDPGKGYGDQQGALEALKGLQQQLQQAGNGKGRKGIPLPLNQGAGRGFGTQNEKVEIPEEDPNTAPREFRRDVMDAMKQGAPERYRDQNKKYYEELVK